MEATKDDLRIQQEESDAILARQLQEEFDTQNQASAAQKERFKHMTQGSELAQNLSPNKTLTVRCPQCTFDNEISQPIRDKHYKCLQCHTQLQLPSTFLREKNEPELRECKICYYKNIIPSKKADALLCGSCFQQLPEPNVPVQSHSTKEPHSVQVKCGQCSAVNLVEVATDEKVIQFECGGCASINEVILP